MYVFRLIGNYTRWLDEGDKVRAAPHNADLSSLISEKVCNMRYLTDHVVYTRHH